MKTETDPTLYWGDLHCHCNISYGHGSLEYALANAQDHLDFCSITGHASWPDMPQDRSQYGQCIDDHVRGFQKLKSAWPSIVHRVNEANRDGQFVTFSSYEWHSMKYGDHNLYFPGDDAPLHEPADIGEIHELCEQTGALAIPHHFGYPQGLRGANWSVFSEKYSPFVEMFSLHGCSEADDAPYPILHTMGPRTTASTAAAGLKTPHRFGFTASTDNHMGYPGHHGAGRIGVYAETLTRSALWQAFRNRHVYAATGDKIAVDFRVNDGFMGDILTGAQDQRMIQTRILASDRIDFLEIIKNGRSFKKLCCPASPPDRKPSVPSGPWKLRIEWGWGDRDRPVNWEGSFRIQDGRIREIEPCFRGCSTLFLEDLEQFGDALPRNRITSQGTQEVTWSSTTYGNPTLLHSSTNSLIIEVEGPLDTPVELKMNHQTVSTTLNNLIESSLVFPMRNWLTESVCLHRAVSQPEYQWIWTEEDRKEYPEDWYYVRVAQKNGQWAWSSPIWITE